MRIPSGSTNRFIYFIAVDDTDGFTRETGLTTFTVYRSRNGGAATAYTTPTINETSAANMPGVYEFQIDEDTTLDAGNDTEEYAIHITHAGMRAVTRAVEIYRPKLTEGETVTAGSGRANADAVAISGDTTAADNLEAAADGTGFNLGGGSIVAASVTGSVGSVAGGDVATWATRGLTMIELDGAVYRYTTNALEQGPVTSTSGLALESTSQAILADTNELQTDWVNGGRLDLILDAIAVDVAGLDGAAMRGTDNAFLAASAPTNFSAMLINASGHVSRVTLVDTTTTNTDMRGTDNAMLAASYTAPDNASIAAILADTGTDGVVVAAGSKTGYSLAATGMNLVVPVEPAAVPAWSTATLPQWVAWVGAFTRNKVTETSSVQALRNDADNANIATAAVSDDATTFTRGEFA